jgi:uncharacterized protein YecT (DUF1311 family)
MRACVVCALLLLAFAAVARAQSQAEINAQACAGFAAADRELNAVYQAVLRQNAADKRFTAKFRAAQRAWVAFRDAEMAARYPAEDIQREYGTMYNSCYCTEVAALTGQRTEALMRWRDGIAEGDGCSGSYPVR